MMDIFSNTFAILAIYWIILFFLRVYFIKPVAQLTYLFNSVRVKGYKYFFYQGESW
jgi:hypothetical protein